MKNIPLLHGKFKIKNINNLVNSCTKVHKSLHVLNLSIPKVI
jgi:hypothetical protein